MINVKSLKFDADQKLLDYVEKKVGKVEKFFDNLGDIDVTLSLSPEPENKCVRLQTRFPGDDLVIERHIKSLFLGKDIFASQHIKRHLNVSRICAL